MLCFYIRSDVKLCHSSMSSFSKSTHYFSAENTKGAAKRKVCSCSCSCTNQTLACNHSDNILKCAPPLKWNSTDPSLIIMSYLFSSYQLAVSFRLRASSLLSAKYAPTRQHHALKCNSSAIIALSQLAVSSLFSYICASCPLSRDL